MTITRDNYEVYAVDYLDGSMNAEQRATFEQFLNLYPDLKAEIDGMDWIILEPQEHIHFPTKTALIKEHKKRIFPLWIAIAAGLALCLLAGRFIMKIEPSPMPTAPLVENTPEINVPERSANLSNNELEAMDKPEIKEEDLVVESSVSDQPKQNTSVKELDSKVTIEPAMEQSDVVITEDLPKLESDELSTTGNPLSANPTVENISDVAINEREPAEMEEIETTPNEIATEDVALSKVAVHPETTPIRKLMPTPTEVQTLSNSLIIAPQNGTTDADVFAGTEVESGSDSMEDEAVEELPSIISFIPNTKRDVAHTSVIADQKDKSLIKETFARIKPFRNQKIDRDDVREALLPSFVTGSY